MQCDVPPFPPLPLCARRAGCERQPPGPAPPGLRAAAMAQLPPLDGARLAAVGAARDVARSALVDALDARAGRKTVVFDARLSGPMALVTRTSTLKEHGVEDLLGLDAAPGSFRTPTVVYIVRPTIGATKALAAHVRAAARASEARTHAVYYVPRRTVVCERILEEEGVLGEVSVEELPIDWIPFDEDVLSLELGSSFKECTVDGDRTSVYYAARALARLQLKIGLVPHIKGVGVNAHACAQVLRRMRKEQGGVGPVAVAPQVDAMVLIDREVDCVTPLLTPLTYEGLIDHFFSVRNGVAELPAGLLGRGKRKGGGGDHGEGQQQQLQAPGRPDRVALNSSDALFKQLRDRNFGNVMAELRDKANAIRNDYDSARDSSAHMSKIRDFVKDLKTLPEIERHISLSDALNRLASKPAFRRRLENEAALVEGGGSSAVDAACAMAEEAAFRRAPLADSLKPLCAASLIAGGLSRRQLDSYRTVLMHAYGHEQLLTLDALLASGLIRRQESGRSSFASCRRSLALSVDELDNDDPEDIAYTFATQGYAPLSIRLVEHALLRPEGWLGVEDALRALPGSHFELLQTFDTNGVPIEKPDEMGGNRLHSAAKSSGGTTRRVVLVVFLGGVTFAEIAALRFLSSRSDIDFVVAATELISGDGLIESIVPPHAAGALAGASHGGRGVR